MPREHAHEALKGNIIDSIFRYFFYWRLYIGNIEYVGVKEVSKNRS